MVVNAERLVRDVDNKFEVWRARVDGRVVTAEVKYADFLAERGQTPFRDFVISQLISAARRGIAA